MIDPIVLIIVLCIAIGGIGYAAGQLAAIYVRYRELLNEELELQEDEAEYDGEDFTDVY